MLYPNLDICQKIDVYWLKITQRMTRLQFLGYLQFFLGPSTSAIFLLTNQIAAFKFYDKLKAVSDFLKELNYLQKNKNNLFIYNKFYDDFIIIFAI